MVLCYYLYIYVMVIGLLFWEGHLNVEIESVSNYLTFLIAQFFPTDLLCPALT